VALTGEKGGKTHSGWADKRAFFVFRPETILKFQECDFVFVADHLSDFFLDGFLKALHGLSMQPPVIVRQSDRPRSWEVGPYRQLGGSGAVNKARPCEILEAANEVLCSGQVSQI